MIDKIRKLSYGIFQLMKRIHEILYNFGNEKHSIEELFALEVNEFHVILNFLSIDIETKDLLQQKMDLEDPRLITFVIENCTRNEKLLNAIRAKYGSDIVEEYLITSMTLVCTYVLNIIILFNKNETFGDEKREKLVKQEVDSGVKFLDLFASFIINRYDKRSILQNDSISEKYLALSKSLLSCSNEINLKEAYETSLSIGVELFKDLANERNGLDAAREINNRLKKCPPGKKYWRDYENICITALNFLFIPPFRRVFFQARTKDGYERRDAIISNTVYSGFWRNIKEEFKSKNIVFEFKNYKLLKNKDSLNQLRIYLSKKTIGKFGVLFCRDKVSQAIIKAQKDAYEQSDIFILIINDALLNELLILKSYFGSCDELIEIHKTKFEIEY